MTRVSIPQTVKGLLAKAFPVLEVNAWFRVKKNKQKKTCHTGPPELITVSLTFIVYIHIG